jgi:hypothetical protein
VPARVLRVHCKSLLKQIESALLMPKAMWNGQVLAESDTTEKVEGYTYFPEESVKREFLRAPGRDRPATTRWLWMDRRIRMRPGTIQTPNRLRVA